MNKIIFAIGIIGAFLLGNGMLLDLLTTFDKLLTSFEMMVLVGLNLVCLSWIAYFCKEEL